MEIEIYIVKRTAVENVVELNGLAINQEALVSGDFFLAGMMNGRILAAHVVLRSQFEAAQHNTVTISDI